MKKDDIIKYRGSELGIVIIPSSSRQLGPITYSVLNLVPMEDGRLVAARDDELELIQLPIEE